VQRAVISSRFYAVTGLVGAVGTALVYWVGGYLVVKAIFTIGTIVAFSTYLTRFYGILQSLSDAPMSFATSLISFERVFEVIDLPFDIVKAQGAHELEDVQGAVEFRHVTFASLSHSSPV
jgi:ATP-binding cassette subfamily B protein